MRVCVIGGGIAGLSAAHVLAAAGVDVVLCEASADLGGKIAAGTVDGLTLDVGAESVLARRPEALDLIDHVGLGPELVHPAALAPSVWTRGVVRRLPRTIMGVPVDLEALAASGIVADIPGPIAPDLAAAMPSDDVSVRAFLEPRVGREVVDRLIEPLLGGVYAGHADRLSLRSAAAQIAALGPDPLAAAAASAVVTASSAAAPPVFAGIAGGLHRLPQRLGERLREQGADVRCSMAVRAIEPQGSAWRVTAGPRGSLVDLDVDAVLVAAPAPATARLLGDVAAHAAYLLSDIELASVALVTFVVDGGLPGDSSGFLVPPVDGTDIKAATFSSTKWPWVAALADGRQVVRASLGRAAQSDLLGMDDHAIADLAVADLRRAVPDLGTVLGTAVTRWGAALPQYDVGHEARMAAIDASLAAIPGLEVCGAYHRGVGIPAVIADATQAARALLSRPLGTMAS